MKTLLKNVSEKISRITTESIWRDSSSLSIMRSNKFINFLRLPNYQPTSSIFKIKSKASPIKFSLSITKLVKQFFCNFALIFSIGQSTNLSKFVSRKKIDEEFQKMGIIRKYDPKSRIFKCNIQGKKIEQVCKKKTWHKMQEILHLLRSKRKSKSNGNLKFQNKWKRKEED